jgi:type II secretory pathway component GspD/PulD (secretin)
MKMKVLFTKLLTLMLVVSFCLPAAVFADKKADTRKAKKNFSEGQKYEGEEKWDLATQSFLLAIAADPNNPEYRLHAINAGAKASLMFAKRGDGFATEGDYASAYTAYKQAYAYDQTNEIALVKMTRMFELQKAQSSGETPASYNVQNGNYIRSSADIVTPQPRQSRSKDVASTVTYKDITLKETIKNISRQLDLNVIFDDSFRDQPKYTLELRNTSLARALDFVFIQNKLVFEQLDRRTLLIYFDNPTNRQRFERQMIKTFYVTNAKLEDAQRAVQQMLQNGGGAIRQIVTAPNMNALIIRATPEELKMVQDLLDSIDKNKAEVAIDVEIYEVTHDTMLQLGNQIATGAGTANTLTATTRGNVAGTLATSGINNLGGLGAGAVGLLANAIGIGGGLGGAILSVPPTSLSLLQEKKNAKLLNRVNVHALDGQSNKTNVGRRIPISLGSQIPSVVGTGTPQVGGAIGGGLGSLGGGYGGGYGGFSSIQYQDVGLNIDVTPIITNEGYIELKMTLESSSAIPNSTAGSELTPEISQRKLQTVSRILDGRTAVVAGVQQLNKSDGRKTIPVIGMIPILGRFITTPNETSAMSDIVITVTPHIIRAPQIERKDHLAKESGTGLGNATSVEQVLMRAQDDDDQDRRVIALAQPAPEAAPTRVAENAPLTPPSIVQVSNPQPSAAVMNSAVSNANNTANNSRPAPMPVSQPQRIEPAQQALQQNEDQSLGASSPENFVEQRPIIRSASMTPEQKKLIDEARTKATRTPQVQESNNVAPIDVVTPEREMRPRIAPMPSPKLKIEPNQSAQSEPKEMSKVETKTEVQVGSDPLVGLTLRLKENKTSVGESFIVVVAVDGKSKVTGANIGLNFDSTLLQLKSVRDGGLMGKNPDITQSEKNGDLLVTVQQANDNRFPAISDGRLLILEFKAIGSGSTTISFNEKETKFLAGNLPSPTFSISPAQLEISRPTISKLNEK